MGGPAEGGASRSSRPRIDAGSLVVAIAGGMLTWSQLSRERATWATLAIGAGLAGLWAWSRTGGHVRKAVVAGCGVLVATSLVMVQSHDDKPPPPPPVTTPPSAGPDADAPAAQPSRRQGPPLPGHVLERPGQLFPQLRTDAVVPRKGFDPRTWSYTDDDQRGVTFECRSAADHGAGCTPEGRPVFFIDPAGFGTGVAVVPPSAPATHVCAGSAYGSRAVLMQAGRTYCVTGNDGVLVVDVTKLPDHVFRNDIVVPELHVEFWKRS